MQERSKLPKKTVKEVKETSYRPTLLLWQTFSPLPSLLISRGRHGTELIAAENSSEFSTLSYFYPSDTCCCTVVKLANAHWWIFWILLRKQKDSMPLYQLDNGDILNCLYRVRKGSSALNQLILCKQILCDWAKEPTEHWWRRDGSSEHSEEEYWLHPEGCGNKTTKSLDACDEAEPHVNDFMGKYGISVYCTGKRLHIRNEYKVRILCATCAWQVELIPDASSTKNKTFLLSNTPLWVLQCFMVE